MPQSLRHMRILEMARSQGSVRVPQIARVFDVTLQTARRDLSELCAEGLLSRVHGGAVLPSGTSNIGYDRRRSLNADAKARIGALTARQIPDGASVFLDIGTTAEAVAEALLRHEGLMVVTNNLNVANILARAPQTEVLLAGGVLRRADGGLVGDITAEFVRQFKVDVAVICASGIDAQGDALDFDFREVRVAQAVMANARRALLVADQAKLRRTAPVRLASLGQFDGWITDAAPPQALSDLCRVQDTAVIWPDQTPVPFLQRLSAEQ